MEPALGIIAACVATFRPLFRGWGFGWTSTRTGHSNRIQASGVERGDKPFSVEANRVASFRRRANMDEDSGSLGSELNFNISKVVEIEAVSERREQPGSASNGGDTGTFYKDLSDSEMGVAVSRW